MFRTEKVFSLDLPELPPYATMRRPLEHERHGIFVAEGTKVVRRLLESSFAVVSVLLPEKHLDDFRPLLEARPENLSVYLADKQLLEQLIGFSMYQGVLAVGKIPPPATLDEIFSKSSKPLLLAAVDGLTSAENLGALVRNCVAFGVQALIVGETSSSPFLRRAVRNSMGTILQLPVIELAKLGQRHQFTDKPHVTDLTLVGMSEAIARPRRPLHRRASAHGQKIPVAGGFLRRLLRCFRQRRRWHFPGGFGGLRRSRGHSHAADGGFAQRGRRGGGFSLRGQPAAQTGKRGLKMENGGWHFKGFAIFDLLSCILAAIFSRSRP